MRALKTAGLILAASVLAGAAPFRPLGLKAAKAAAASEGKSLLVYVVTGHCPPCERMHRTTFKDPAVLAFLAKRAVAVEFNADQDRVLEAELRITQFPTSIFFDARGNELDRLFGFDEAKPFLAAFEDALAGRTSIDRAREAAAAAKDARGRVRARHDLARSLAGAGRGEEALAEFLWLYDQGHKEDPGFSEMRAVLLPVEIGGLGRSYPPALAALRERRAAAAARLKGPSPLQRDAADVRLLTRALAESDMAAKH